MSHIIHVYPHFDADEETRRRELVAQKTWIVQPWEDNPVLKQSLTRTHEEDGRHYFYIKDVFDLGVKSAYPDDIICYTNSDIGVHSNTCEVLRDELDFTDATYCYRRDFHRRIDEPIPDDQIKTGDYYSGKDLFAFKAEWWSEYRGEMPDMILGFEAWDAVLQELIDKTNGRYIMSELQNLIWHEAHPSRWKQPENRYSLPGQKMCLKLAHEWMIKNGINPDKHGIKLAI